MVNTELERLVRAICPDLPEDKQVKSSHDQFSWFKVIRATNTLVIPPINYIKSNMIMLDKTVEALTAFAQMQEGASEYDWEHLNLYEASTPENILVMLREIPRVVTDGFVACDIETRRIEWEDNCLLSIGFAISDDTCYAIHNIPIPGARTSNPINREVWETLQLLFHDPNIKWCWHNGKFDCGRLKYLCNIDAHIDEDSMLAHYAYINEKRGTHGLKDLGPLYLQAPQWDNELEKLKKQYCREHKLKLSEFMYDMIPTDILIPYMQRDCIASRRLLKLFKRIGRPEAEFIYGKLIEASNAYMRVELNGIALDMNYLEDLEYDLEKEYEEAQKHLSEVVAEIWDPVEYAKKTGAKSVPKGEFNIKSPKQLKWMLETVLGMPVNSTDATTIEELMDEVEAGVITNPQARSFLEAIGRVRKNSKYMDTYIQGYRECVCRDCRIRGTFNLHGTETGRLSSSNPNMQNVPRDKRIKNLMYAPPGKVLVQMDYSQAELRVLALLSEDPWLTQVYVDGKDLHDAIATDMFGPNFNKEQRVMAKTINFGIAYGRGPGSIARTFKKSMGEAKAIIDKWYRPMPKVRAWIENRRIMARRGEPCTTVFGRDRHFVMTNENRNHIENEYINTPIQSIASDFTMFSLLEIDQFLTQENLRDRAQIVTTVHDSIILEVDADEIFVRKIAEKCANIMATVPQRYLDNCPVPFKADVEVGPAWGKLKSLEEYYGNS